MAGNPHRYRAALQQLESRHATAGCLLALLLLLPLAARSVPVAVLSVAVLLYVTLVVPVATGFLSATVVIGWFRICTARHSLSAWDCLHGVLSCVRACHNAYLPLQRLHTTTSQVLFNLAAERLLCPDQPGSCLYALLLCSILGYVHNSLKRREWTQLPALAVGAGGGGLGGLLGSVGSLVTARLAKAVVLAFGLLSLSERIDRLQPGAAFMIVSSAYFVLNQWPGRAGEQTAAVELVVSALSLAPRSCYLGRLEALEGLEEWWVPLGTRAVAAASAAVLGLLVAREGSWLLAACVLYACALVPLQAGWRSCWPPLRAQLQLTARFPRPSAEQVLAAATCAVCLDALTGATARRTPCAHVFHSRCLRECAHRFGTCPLCKRSLLQS
ncbi:E3 ubiquitin-protein ligase hrd-1 [Frankliniella fusca]|uniref:E3 ubiquitin-protein ligase hrd-1 n=1 Tax=Frankliniella fusca TaxID=407009 RepID=A0AAE1L6G3_9NEOP|nr:E3 ubiquitin-protein ligase hrd-1 [Frankliniella fusca]